MQKKKRPNQSRHWQAEPAVTEKDAKEEAAKPEPALAEPAVSEKDAKEEAAANAEEEKKEHLEEDKAPESINLTIALGKLQRNFPPNCQSSRLRRQSQSSGQPRRKRQKEMQPWQRHLPSLREKNKRAPQVEVEQEAEGLPLQALKTGDEEKAVDAEEVARVAPPDEENDKKRKQEGNSAASAEEQVLDFLARGKLRLLKKTARLPKRKKTAKAKAEPKASNAREQKKAQEKASAKTKVKPQGKAKT